MDCFAALAMTLREFRFNFQTADKRPHSRGTILPEVCISLSLKHEGAGNAGCALHPRSRVQKAEKKTHTSIQVQRRLSDIPCAMALRLIPRSGERIRLVTVAAGLTADRPGWIDFATDSLAPATGVGTTRFCRTQQRRSSARRPIAHGSGSIQNPPCNSLARLTLPRPPRPTPRP